MFEPDEHAESLAGDLVRFFGRGKVDAFKAAALIVIIVFWVAVVIWLVLAYLG